MTALARRRSRADELRADVERKQQFRRVELFAKQTLDELRELGRRSTGEEQLAIDEWISHLAELVDAIDDLGERCRFRGSEDLL